VPDIHLFSSQFAKFVPEVLRLASEFVRIRTSPEITTPEGLANCQPRVWTINDRILAIADSLPRCECVPGETETVMLPSTSHILKFGGDQTTPKNLQPILRMTGKQATYTLEMGDMLSEQGVYSHVYAADWVIKREDGKTGTYPAVVKTPLRIPQALWLVVETIIQTHLANHSLLRPYFAQVLAFVYEPLIEWPHKLIMLVQTRHPGLDLTSYLMDMPFDKRVLTAILQQAAYILYLSNEVCTAFAHRDLKPDNIMINGPHTHTDFRHVPKRMRDNHERSSTIYCEDDCNMQFQT